MNTDDASVFCSKITKNTAETKNNLFDLLIVEPAKPLPATKNQNETSNQKETQFNFTPYTNKRYFLRKTSKLKVKTVRDIRALYEQDVISDIPSELEKQKTYLMKKIRYGFSSNEHTKNTAKSMLSGDKPISTSAWQMLSNINPYNNKFPKQYVLWNGRRIHVNGSRGGKTKFICNYDLTLNKSKMKKSNFTNSVIKKKAGLLRNSLNIKFKPGPLQKKKFLDESYHKYNMGEVELISLPKPVLDIFPSYGNPVNPSISGLINNLRDDSGLISPKLAEYSVSMLGTLTKNNSPAQLDKESCVTIDLNYNYGQNRLLTRRHVSSELNTFDRDNNKSNIEKDTKTEVQEVMQKIIDSVEISLMQDEFYSLDSNMDEEIYLSTKDKVRKKCSELNRLDVTVINIPQLSQKADNKPCEKSFCSLGCICDSLDCSFTLKQHCGNLDCMFGCKCNLSKFKDIDLLERGNSELLSGLVKLDKELNSHLAKEEQKFHQTVIVSGERSILLKSRKRKCKSSQKYAEYCNTISGPQNEESAKSIPIVKLERISLSRDSIEPLCMVHNLYKCFCKGKFTDSSLLVDSTEKTKLDNNINGTEIISNTDENKYRKSLRNLRTSTVTGIVHVNPEETKRNNLCDLSEHKSAIELVDLVDNDSTYYCKCARTNGYNGRKYSDGYYESTNLKIKQMEENDELLKIRMRSLIHKANIDSIRTRKETSSSESELGDMHLYYDDNSNDSNSKNNNEKVEPEHVSIHDKNTKYNIKDWLAMAYRSYKERRVKGLPVHTLKPPQKGMACLLSWEVILKRYRERKNIYLVSTQPPFRAFLCVNKNVPELKHLLNIDDIRFADLPKYPPIVQNLVTNTSEVSNTFCILRGWNLCWELMYASVKIRENTEHPEMPPIYIDSEISNDWLCRDKFLEGRPWNAESLKCPETKPKENKLAQERSKWFVMKIENDFNEIQFIRKGFFVTYEGIQRSIKLARVSGKTVRLSPQTPTDDEHSTQFGIYAIPTTKESCVFIGPYEENESLGIETVTTHDTNKKKKDKTRGVWIITNKIDNAKVLEHPLSYIPSSSTLNDDISLDSSSADLQNSITNEHSQNNQNLDSSNEPKKTIKPITIRRTNIIQKLPSNSLLIKNKSPIVEGPISLLKGMKVLSENENSENENSCPSTSVAYVKPFVETAKLDKSEEIATNTATSNAKPIAEIAPQIKITCVYSEKSFDQDRPDISSGSTKMMILKPDEINKRIGLAVDSSGECPNSEECNEDTAAADVECFLEKHTACVWPEDVLVISDCEEDSEECKPIWIQCINIPLFGHFPGTLKGNNLLSFKIPGFNYSEFYPQEEAFTKINLLLERKIYIPKFVTLKWSIVYLPTHLKSHVLTTSHLADKKYLFNLLRSMRNLQGFSGGRPIYKVKSEKPNKASTSESESIPATPVETISLIEELEETSKELDNFQSTLFSEAVANHGELGRLLALPPKIKLELTEKLKDIFELNNE